VSLNVLAAGSLQAPFDALAERWRARGEIPVVLSYANARDLAARVVAGEPADVFASASPDHPQLLHARGLLDAPRAFATNRLVVAVPAGSDARDTGILAATGTRAVIEVEGIPLGDYTRTLLGRLDDVLGRGFARAALRNVVCEEQTVAAVAERLQRGEADAAVLYNTDVRASQGRLRAIEIPPAAAVRGTYVIATVRAARHPAAARAWLDLTLGSAGRDVLAAAGFDVI